MEYVFLFFMIVGGVLAGILVGAIPGLTATMAIALLVPITFYMDAVPAISLLLGLYVGAMFGGSIASILVGIPGTPAATATLLDGYPMGQKGRAGEAIGIAALASFIGGMVSVIILFTVARPVARLSLNFASPEYFALAVIGLTLCITLSTKSVVKGIISGLIGLGFALVGMDEITGLFRFTFGRMELAEGIPFIPAMIGLFGLAELLSQPEQSDNIHGRRQDLSRVLPTIGSIGRYLKIMVRGGIIGSLVGTIPGTGGNVAAFLSYDVSKRFSKQGADYGCGNPEGVAATESGNNGVTGGALIPLLTFGIPGDSVAAVLLGALMIHGLRPGRALFEAQASMTYLIFAGMAVANVVMLLAGISLARVYARLITLPSYILNPTIAVLCMVGAYSMRSSLFDVWIMVGMGLLGYVMQRFGFSTIPLVLGLILGQMAESNFRRALLLSHGSISVFVGRPITAVLLLLAVALLAAPFLQPLWGRLRSSSPNIGHEKETAIGRWARRTK